MTRLLVDESLPRAVGQALASAGHDVVDVRDIGLRGCPDSEIQARAAAERRVIASADLDFANAVRFPPGTHPGVAVLRVPNSWDSRSRAERFVSALTEVPDDALSGALLIIEPDRLRLFGPRSG